MSNILIIGSGAREHAILDGVRKSRGVTRVFVAPGNAGMATEAECVDIAADQINKLLAFAQKERIDLTIVGPERPLTLGIVDAFEKAGLKIFGPSRVAAIVEGSKIFTKEFCARHGIPTAPFAVFSQVVAARDYLAQKNSYPIVIKADGLAAGKGVIIATNPVEADQAINAMLEDNKFGTAGHRIVIEDFMPGIEASFIVLTDGKDVVEFPPAQDHKRVFDNERGPNTGGMGAYAPAKVVTEAVRQRVLKEIIQPTLQGLAAEGRRYVGFLYAGLMIGPDGAVRLVEYNCRLGDPEAQAILPLLKSDFVSLINDILAGNLAQVRAEFEDASCVCVVLAAHGYPGDTDKGLPITGIEAACAKGARVFHAGTNRVGNGFVTSGGRVLTVSVKAATLSQAIGQVYAAIPQIHWDGVHYRSDIGKKGL